MAFFNFRQKDQSSLNRLKRDFWKYIEELTGNKLSWEIRGLYFLVNKHELLYIGSTNNLINRLGQHCLDKDYDLVLFIQCISADRKLLYRVERGFINCYQPRLNFENHDKLSIIPEPISVKALTRELKKLNVRTPAGEPSPAAT